MKELVALRLTVWTNFPTSIVGGLGRACSEPPYLTVTATIPLSIVSKIFL